jgi:hypothetical protein
MTSPNSVGQLSAEQRRLLLVSLVALPPIDLALRLIGYYRLRRIAEWLTAGRQRADRHATVPALPRAQQIARAVSIAARHGFIRATCLRRSVLLWWMLRHRGIQSDICFGVRTHAGRLEAHSWVELDGAVLDDDGNIRQEYRALRGMLPPTSNGL